MSVRVCNYSRFVWWLQRTSVYTNKDFPLLHLTQLFTNVTTNTHAHMCTHAECNTLTRRLFFNRASFLVKKNRHPVSQTLCQNASAHTHFILTGACVRARALTRSSLVVSSFGIQLHPQSKQPPSRSRREQSTYADSGCGAQHSGKKKEQRSVNKTEDQPTRFVFLRFIIILSYYLNT